MSQQGISLDPLMNSLLSEHDSFSLQDVLPLIRNNSVDVSQSRKLNFSDDSMLAVEAESWDGPKPMQLDASVPRASDSQTTEPQSDAEEEGEGEGEDDDSDIDMNAPDASSSGSSSTRKKPAKARSRSSSLAPSIPPRRAADEGLDDVPTAKAALAVPSNGANAATPPSESKPVLHVSSARVRHTRAAAAPAPTTTSEPAAAPVEGVEVARKRSQRAAATVSRRKFEESEDEFESDDELDPAMPADRTQQIVRLKKLLADKVVDLNAINTQCKGLNPSDRKKIRNRKASCVSRLKKKLQLYELENRLAEQARRINELEAALQVRGALLRSHNISFPDVTLSAPAVHAVVEEVPPRASPQPNNTSTVSQTSHARSITHHHTRAAATPSPVTPVAALAPSRPESPAESLITQPTPPTLAVVVEATPRRPRGRPSKKVKLMEKAAAVAQETSLLVREPSVPDRVCICYDRATDDMVACTRCAKPFHPLCVGMPDPAAFICYDCC